MKQYFRDPVTIKWPLVQSIDFQCLLLGVFLNAITWIQTSVSRKLLSLIEHNCFLPEWSEIPVIIFFALPFCSVFILHVLIPAYHNLDDSYTYYWILLAECKYPQSVGHMLYDYLSSKSRPHWERTYFTSNFFVNSLKWLIWNQVKLHFPKVLLIHKYVLEMSNCIAICWHILT